MLKAGHSILEISRNELNPSKNSGKQTFSNFRFEFHIAKEIRKKYKIEDELFAVNGNVIFTNNNAVRVFVQNINSRRDISAHIRIGEVNAVGIVDEIFHFILREYEEKENPGVFSRAVDYLNENLGEEELNKIIFEFVELFPPMDVYKGKTGVYDYLNSYSGNKSNREAALEELLLLYFANINKAARNLKELFDDNYFSHKNIYKNLFDNLEEFFKQEKTFGPNNTDVFTLLKEPLINHPENLYDQLDFILERWNILLTEKISKKVLISKDLMAEDIKFENFSDGEQFAGPPTVVPSYKGNVKESDNLVIGKSMFKYGKDQHLEYDEPEQFTADIEWMPRVVLMAKNVFVWLDQLSKEYGRHIHRLDQIPDEELDKLAKWNFNGLWLIGLWERSSASKKIKHIMGNVDAVASAYSLYDYQIAYDLGGEEAYHNLNERAKSRGIRLASDMVPNHTGIHSDWVINHPEYFVQSDFPPFPNYRFSGEDLSEDPNIQVRIEDGYWSHKDAAVVFQRIENKSGRITYIYHGNDGTNMPWNDTAQLNMIKKEVREAVIQKIFDVARKFSIIRFDAAMTLTKKHFSRLWYPQPGMGGDIPSRTDYSLTRSEFDELFPEEFWREVVDRINKEMPETLLLAEAFWLMEGYFVRTLGMHRVYNSAFMHMMMKEENEKYRDLITNTLEFEPEILKRYVNFMSNPDEETAIHQFGTDNKYFGVAALMVTLPGLPMFGHGQVEGYTEKYGMEYKRAYYNERPKDWLVERHEREIFPLMRKRYLFSQVTNFWLYNFVDQWENINENVFAYTNSAFGERALVLYNNKYESASGRIFHSTPKLISNEDETKSLKTQTIADAFQIKNDKKYYYIYKEHVSGLEYLKNGHDIHKSGFEIELHGFQSKIFFGFREVFDEKENYSKLEKYLNGGGTEDINLALKEMELEPVHNSYAEVFNSGILDQIVDGSIYKDENNSIPDTELIEQKFNAFLKSIEEHFDVTINENDSSKSISDSIIKVINANKFMVKDIHKIKALKRSKLIDSFQLNENNNYGENFTFYLLFESIYHLQKSFNESLKRKENILEAFYLDKPVNNILRRHGKGNESRYRKITLINILLKYSHLFGNDSSDASGKAKRSGGIQITVYKELIKLIENDFVQSYIGVNLYEEIVYFSKEKFNELINWLFTFALIENFPQGEKEDTVSKERILSLIDFSELVKMEAVNSGFQLEVLKSNFEKMTVKSSKTPGTEHKTQLQKGKQEIKKTNGNKAEKE